MESTEKISKEDQLMVISIAVCNEKQQILRNNAYKRQQNAKRDDTIETINLEKKSDELKQTEKKNKNQNTLNSSSVTVLDFAQRVLAKN